MTRQLLAVAALLLSNCRHIAGPQPPPVSALFMAAPAIDDCVEMARRLDRIGAWAPRYRNERGEEVALYPSDELWVLNMFMVPPSRGSSPAHGVRSLTLTCGPEQRALRALACRRGTGLHLYVDPAQLSGWQTRGTVDAACRVDADIEGVVYRDDRKILLRGGLRARLGPIDPSPNRYNEPPAPTARVARPAVVDSLE